MTRALAPGRLRRDLPRDVGAGADVLRLLRAAARSGISCPHSWPASSRSASTSARTGPRSCAAAIVAVDPGQREAAIALNLHAAPAMRRIILPQALVEMIPPFGNLLIELLKGTALVSLITLTELAFAGKLLAARPRPTRPRSTSLVLVMYFLLAFRITRGSCALPRAAPARAGLHLGPARVTLRPRLRAARSCRCSLRRRPWSRSRRPSWAWRLAVVGRRWSLAHRAACRRCRPVSLVAGGVRPSSSATRRCWSQLFFLFYILPVCGLTLAAFTTGVVALGLHYSTYTAEVYRAGIEGVPRGQWEAATRAEPAAAQHLAADHPAAGDPAGRSRARQLPDRDVQGHADAGRRSRCSSCCGAALTEAGRTFRYLEPFTIVGLAFLA